MSPVPGTAEKPWPAHVNVEPAPTSTVRTFPPVFTVPFCVAVTVMPGATVMFPMIVFVTYVIAEAAVNSAVAFDDHPELYGPPDGPQFDEVQLADTPSVRQYKSAVAK